MMGKVKQEGRDRNCRFGASTMLTGTGSSSQTKRVRRRARIHAKMHARPQNNSIDKERGECSGLRFGLCRWVVVRMALGLVSHPRGVSFGSREGKRDCGRKEKGRGQQANGRGRVKMTLVGLSETMRGEKLIFDM